MMNLSALQDCAATIEALIFASDRPVRERELELHLPEGISIKEVLDIVSHRYDKSSGIELCQIADAWAFRTKIEIAERLAKHRKVERPLSRAAMEVLAIIAYHQPITRSEIEEIRGVNLSKGTMDILLEVGWINPRGRRRTPGRPLTWGTTPSFLDHFGLATVSDLPGLDDLQSAGLLRKGQILGALMDQNPEDEGLDHELESTEESFFDSNLNGDDDASI